MGVKGMHSSPRQLANLKRFGHEVTGEKHLELSSRGGTNGAALGTPAEGRKRKQTFREAANWFLSLPAMKTENEAVNAIMEKFPDMDNAQAMTIAVIAKAISEGDVKAFSTIRDTTGELPEQTVNLKNEEPMEIFIKTV